MLDLWSVHTKSPVLSWRFPVVHSVTELETFSSPLMPPTTNTYRCASESHSTLKKIQADLITETIDYNSWGKLQSHLFLYNSIKYVTIEEGLQYKSTRTRVEKYLSFIFDPSWL